MILLKIIEYFNEIMKELNQNFIGQKRQGSRGITEVSRSMWKVTKGKKIEVAMKTLKRDCLDQYLKVSEFLE